MTNPKKWLARNKIPIVISVVFISAGFIGGLATHPYAPFRLEFENNINGVELFGIICTVLLVWIVANSLDKKKQTDQNAKTLISRRLEEAYELTLKMHERVNEDEVQLVYVTSSLKRISLIVNGADKSLDACDFKVNGDVKANISAQISTLRDLLTNTPVDQQNSDDAPVRIQNGTLAFSSNRSMEISTAFDSIREMITLYQLAVNEA